MSSKSVGGDNGRQHKLTRILAQIQARREAGKAVDVNTVVRAFPELEAELRAYFAAEAGQTPPDDAFASTRLQPPELREDAGDTQDGSGPKADTASEFTSRMFGRYQLLRRLGEGAMGSVFLAKDTTLDRQVALKMPKPAAAGSSEFLSRFAREARAAAALNHPNICRVYDTGEIDGTAFITMDYIEGVPLSRLIGTPALKDVEEVLRIGKIIAEAIAHAHTNGVIHRDLKPGNILVDEQQKAFVTDFGLARRIVPSDGTHLTQEGLLIGTPAYMAPEQVRGEQEKVGVTSDIYSFGVVLFEMLVGRLPFDGKVPDLLAKVLRDPPPVPSRLRNDLSEEIDDLVLKMLQKDPVHRFRSMNDVISAMERVEAVWSRSKSATAASSIMASVPGAATGTLAASSHDVLKAHIEAMLKKGQYATAIQDLEKLAAETAPLAKNAAAWARRKLPEVKAEAKAMSPAALAALLQTAQELFNRYDYGGAIQLLDDVPALCRNSAMEDLLAKARERESAAEMLLDDIRDRERREVVEGLEPLVRKYLKLKPGNAYAKKLMQALQTYSKTPATRRRYRFERGRLQPMPEISFFRRYAFLAFLVGVLSFLVAYSFVVIYLKNGSHALAVQVDDEWLKEQGGELTLVVDGDEHTISTSSSNPEPLKILVKLGERQFSVKHGDAIVHNPRTFIIEREGRSILRITPTNMELRNLPEIESMRPGSESSELAMTGDNSKDSALLPARIRPISELNTGALDISAWVSSDGLRIYWERRDAAASDGVIMQAERKTAGAPFENPRELLKGSHPTLSDDELEIVFIHTGTAGPKTLMRATRANRAAEFSTATEIATEQTYFTANSPFLSADGLTLTVNLKNNADNLSTRYVQLRRISRSGQWGGDQELNVEWNATEQGCQLTWIAMAPDELSFLATHEQERGGFRVLRFRRSSTDQPFTDYQYLSLPGAAEVYGRTPRYIPATKELFLSAPAVYPTSRDMNAWTNNYQGRLWVVENAGLDDKPSDSRLTQSESPTGTWIDLFDGKDTSRWQSLGEFQVKDGVLVASNGRTIAVSKDEYADFELEVEWKLSGTTPNGGIYYRELATTRYEGNEYQLIDPAHRLANAPVFRTGALYGILPTKEGVEKPPGEWNLTKIVCRGPVVEHWLNNQMLFSYDTTSDAWKQAVLKSSLQRDKDRIGTARRGHILLQGQTGDVAYRKVRIRETFSGGVRTAASSEASPTELDRLATGQWRPLITDSTAFPEPDKMIWKNGVLSLKHCFLRFPEIHARNIIVRGQIRKMEGECGAIHLRAMKSSDPGADGGTTRVYNAFYDNSDPASGQFGVGKTGAPWKILSMVPSQRAYAIGDFIPIAFAAIEDRLIVFSDGKEVINVSDSSFSAGSVTLTSWRGSAEFRNMEYQILDAPSVPASSEPTVPATSGMTAEPGVAPFTADDAFKLQQVWSDHLKVPVEWTNSIGMKFRLIPPGEFTIGSSREEIDAARPRLTTDYDGNRPERADSEAPQRRITISKPFYLGLTEVTQSQYQTVTGVNPSSYQRGGEGSDKFGDADRSQAPVELVTWLDTGIFCDRLSSHERLASAYHTTPEMISLTGSGGYRLPTEAEWEYACRAGTETLFFSGNDEERLKEFAWFAGNNPGFPQPVATRKANSFGLYDMHGSVWEWVHDSWRPNTYELMTGAGAIDPRCDLGFANWKIIRGGSFHYAAAEARAGCRDAYPADNRWHDTGFRVAISVDAVRQKVVNVPPQN